MIKLCKLRKILCKNCTHCRNINKRHKGGATFLFTRYSYTMHLFQNFIPVVYSNRTLQSSQSYYSSAGMRPPSGEGSRDHVYTSVIPTPRSSAQQPQPTLNQSKSVGLDVCELKEYSSDKLVYYSPNSSNSVYDELDHDYFEPSPSPTYSSVV